MEHRVCAADVDEAVLSGEHVAAYLERISFAKLEAVAALPACQSASRQHSVGILVADTSVVLDDQILGKPAEAQEAMRMVVALAGREHRVLTRYVIARLSPAGLEPLVARTETTHVAFRACSPAVLRRYAESGEGADKAGGYAIQGLGSFLVRAIRGSYSNVVGLPACEVVEDLERLGWLSNYPR